MSAPAASPRIAVVGRQNVGKSTLANRLFGRREAIAHDMPGVTRDRVELEAVWRGKRFGLVDTAGYVQDATGVEELARVQADTAMRDADLILLIVDAQAGITEADAALARRLRRVERSRAGRREQGRRCRGGIRRRGVPCAGTGGHRSRCPACTGAPPAICSTASSNCSPMPRRYVRMTTSSRGSRWSADRTSASRACSTGSSARSAPSCSKRPARRATRSTT